MKKFDPEALGPLLHGTARAWRLQLDERLRPMGLSQARWRTLLLLSLTPHALTQAEIASHLGIEEPTLVALLHHLEEEGWVSRRNSPRDRRCKTVHLQRRAHRLIGQISATAVELRRDLIRDVSLRVEHVGPGVGCPVDTESCMRVLNQIRKRAERPPSMVRNGGKPIAHLNN